MAAKRPSLVEQMKAAAERSVEPEIQEMPAPDLRLVEPAIAPRPAEPAPKLRSRELTDRSVTTAIHLPKDDLALLRRVAVERANRDGGRPSVSDVLRELIETHRAKLEGETRR